MAKATKTAPKVRAAASGKHHGEAAAAITPQRLERATRPAKCPNCGHSPVAEILWGMPAFSEKLEADLKAGRVKLGGCIVSDDDPAWECQKCGVAIYRKQA
jgi:predicted RNA-binding Zn-ribbon protein involved in translation (DUF1610 family)